MSISDRLDQIEARRAQANSSLNGRHMLVGKDVPEMLAAIRAVLDLHEAVPVYQLRDEFGGFATNDDGERIMITTLCRECSSDEAIESVKDQEWDEGWAPEVSHPCPTYRTVTAALGEES